MRTAAVCQFAKKASRVIIMDIVSQPLALMVRIQTCAANARRLIAARARCAMAMVCANHHNAAANKGLKRSVANVLKSVKLVWCAMTTAVVVNRSQIAHKVNA